MKERPILFSAEMVRAILEDRKTQTRRVVKPQPPSGCSVGWSAFSGENRIECRSYAIPHQSFIKCPYVMRQKLWVRETFLNNALEGYDPVYFYRADGDDKPEDRQWKPAIFMPRQASRITLEITQVRVERLHEISEEDAILEGIDGRRHPKDKQLWTWKDYTRSQHFKEPIYHYGSAVTPQTTYAGLWESINGKGSWQANPWVWVIRFKRV